MTDVSLDLIALRRLLDVIGGDPEDFDELKEDFLESVPGIVTDLQTASDAGDLDVMRVSSHSLKSNARDFGAPKLAELCMMLEVKCRENIEFESAPFVNAIIQQEAAVREALKSLKVSDLG